MTVSSSLFQQQSYRDAYHSYANALERKSGAVAWDMVILTASNEAQAKAYRSQIDLRLAKRQLPASTCYAVLSDPEGKRVGSGGATLNALRYIKAETGSFSGRVLVIHSGGDSKRVPQYSACGKLFSPVPRTFPDGRRSTLFDEFVIGMSGVPARLREGMLVCSGDVLLLFNPLQIDFYGRGAAALSFKEHAETGKNHGVYLRDGEGNVGRFLHKQPVEVLRTLGAVDTRENVDIDTGAVILDANILNDLFSLINTEDKFKTFVNERARLSFYADFLYPLATGSTLEQFYLEKPEGDYTEELRDCRTALWTALHGYRMKLIRLAPTSFIHLGTTRELLKLVTEDIHDYRFLDWSGNVGTNSRASHFAASNAYVSRCAKVDPGCYVEDSYVHGGSTVGKGCVISGVTLSGETVPDGAVLHGLKLKDGRFVARLYSVDDDPKENRLFGRGLDQPLWTAPLYPVRDTVSEAVAATLRAYSLGFVREAGVAYMSLEDSFAQADLMAIPSWQEKLSDKVRVESLLEAAEDRALLDGAAEAFHHGLSKYAKGLLVSEAESLDLGDLSDFSRAVRIYRVLSKCADGAEKERFSDLCFGVIREAILKGAMGDLEYNASCAIARDEVVVRLPVRVNWGGGWSDTPSYCMEHGGTVLNAAIVLDGRLPVEVVLRRLNEPKVILASADNGSYQEFIRSEDLQDSSNPYDPFALHKAALIACGIVPYRDRVPLEAILARMGGGIYLSTQVVNVPRGSGLGTSSILAGACVKGIFEFTDMPISDEELYNRVLCMEQLMSTGGGWQDQVGGLAPGIKMVTAGVGLHQKIRCAPVCMSAETLTELENRFLLIYTGQRRLARNLLREVMGRYIDSHPDVVRVLYEIQRVAVLMRFELEKGNVDGFARLLSDHWELSKRLDAGCTNTCIDQIFLAIDDLIDGRMICGAGGGGFLQVILKRNIAPDQIRERLAEVFADSGVEVCRCSFYGG